MLEFLEREASRAAAACIKTVELLRLCVPNNGEQVAAKSAAHWLGYGEHGISGNGGINCVSARFENLDRSEGREWLTRGRHAALANGWRACDERSSGSTNRSHRTFTKVCRGDGH